MVVALDESVVTAYGVVSVIVLAKPSSIHVTHSDLTSVKSPAGLRTIVVVSDTRLSIYYIRTAIARFSSNQTHIWCWHLPVRNCAFTSQLALTRMLHMPIHSAALMTTLWRLLVAINQDKLLVYKEVASLAVMERPGRHKDQCVTCVRDRLLG